MEKADDRAIDELKEKLITANKILDMEELNLNFRLFKNLCNGFCDFLSVTVGGVVNNYTLHPQSFFL